MQEGLFCLALMQAGLSAAPCAARKFNNNDNSTIGNQVVFTVIVDFANQMICLAGSICRHFERGLC